MGSYSLKYALEPAGSSHLWGGTRFVILALTLLVLTSVLANNYTFNFTVICMSAEVKGDGANETSHHWLNNAAQVNSLFSASAVGALIGSLVMVPSFHYVGTKHTLTLFGMISGMATVLTPFTVDFSYYTAFVARACQGFAVTMTFPAIGSIANSWSPLSEIGTFISISSVCFQLSSVISMPFSALSCESSLTWRGIYYVEGIVTIGLWLFFMFFYAENVRKHRNVCLEEAEKIMEDKVAVQKRTPAPMLVMSKDPCVIAIWLSCIGYNVGFTTFMYFGPLYLHKVHHLDLTVTGMTTAIPYALCAVVKLIAGPLSDWATFVSERIKIIFFASFSQGAMGLFLGLLAVAATPVQAQIFYTVVIVMVGFNVVGVIKCIQLVGRQHGHFIMSGMTLISNLIVFIMPFVVSIVCPDHTAEQWAKLFIAVAIIIIVANIPFIIYCRVEPAEWTKEDFGKERKSEEEA